MIEILLVSFSIGIVILVIHNSRPITKLKKACKQYESKNIYAAFELLEDIFSKHSDAPGKLAELKFSYGLELYSGNKKNSRKYFNQVLSIRKRLPPNANVVLYELSEAKARLQVAKIQLEEIRSEKLLDKRERSIKSNIQYIKESIKREVKEDFSKLLTLNIFEFAKLKYAQGENLEREGDLIEAIKYYTEAIKYGGRAKNQSYINNSKARIQICQLKLNLKVDEKAIKNLSHVEKRIKNDFYYRYSIYLLEKKDYKKAEKILFKRLNLESKSISALKEIIEHSKKREAILKINSINESLDNLFEKSFPFQEVKDLYGYINNFIPELEIIIPELAVKIKKLQPSLFNRILKHYLNDNKLNKAINLIQKFPSFWNIPELLKNLGVCCFGFINQGNLTEKNYQVIISNWLTSIFSDNVLLNSLEFTSWDDKYTFTLMESIGSHYSFHKSLPDNVNYKSVSNNNISIGSTQIELLNQFESVLQRNLQESSLLKKVKDFYTQEKSAVENIVKIIDTDILLASPYFAKAHNINKDILEKLNKNFIETNNDDVLAFGMPYLIEMDKSEVGKYSKIFNNINLAEKALIARDLSSLKRISKTKIRKKAYDYKSLSTSIESRFLNILLPMLEKDPLNERMILFMEEAIRISPLIGKLKYQYSNYVANLCVSKVNNDEIIHYRALSLMKNAYLLSTDNPRICRNVVSLIRLNLLDVLHDATTVEDEIYKILDKIHPKRSATFIRESNELANLRSEILDQFNDNGQDISLFTEGPIEQSWLKSFTDSPFENRNKRVLTTEGWRMKKAIGYLKIMSDSESSIPDKFML